MDPQDPNHNLLVSVVSELVKEELKRYRQQRHNPRNTYTICSFPDILLGIDDDIRLPKLASLGPCHRGKSHLHSFEQHKVSFLDSFFGRLENKGRDSSYYVAKLVMKMETIKACYHENIILPDNDEELVRIMLFDGCFMIELFLQYEEDRDVMWQWHVPTLISDLLKLENQLPFFVLMDLFEFFNTSHRTLPKLALTFLNQVCNNPLNADSIFQIPNVKHLLDLFRSSLLPLDLQQSKYPQQSKFHPSLLNSLPNVKQLCNVGMRVGKREGKSLLEIDFRKFQIPPIALRIPAIALDDFTCTILFNCVALEQCFQNQTKYFSAYVCFLNCLVKEAEDVKLLRSVDVITCVSLEEKSFIKLLNTLGKNVCFSVKKCYLQKQLQEIHSYYRSWWASIRSGVLGYDNIILYCAIFQIIVGILSWIFGKK